MNFKELHRKHADKDSPTVEGQIRWLQKQGFPQHQIDQGMITVYSEIERKEKDFKSGLELDQYLLDTCKKFRTDELTAYVAKLEEFEAGLKKKWEQEQKKQLEAQQKKPWYKRIFA